MTSAVRNVVLVVVDALRRDRVGCYAPHRSLTPNIDALGERGAVFENAFSCTNTTDPSVTSIHTGRDPETVVKHHGPFVTDREKRRAESVGSVPKVLSDRGYRTVATGRTLGRWHASGFEHYPEVTFDRYKRRRVGEFLEKISPKLRSIAGDVYARVSQNLDSDSGTEVDEFLSEIDDRPFYGFIHMMDTHVPYSHDEALVDELLAEREYPNRDFAEFLAERGDGEYVGDFMTEYADEDDMRVGLARWFAKYDAAVVRADRKIGALIDGLREAGRLDETLVIVTSDHGESLDEHGIYFDHHGLYDPQIRVPLVVVGPSVEDGRHDEFVQLYDLAPTILDAQEGETPLESDGRSFLPLLTGGEDWESHDAVVTQEAHAQSRVSIRTRDHKYIKHVEDELMERERGDSLACNYCNTMHGDERELFDLREDPAESRNVIDERREVAEHLDDRLDAYFDSLSYPGAEGSGAVEYQDEEELMERLEDLGYR